MSNPPHPVPKQVGHHDPSSQTTFSSASSSSASSALAGTNFDPHTQYFSSPSGGSRLCYSFFGSLDQTARTVLFFPGAGLGRLSLPIDEERLKQMNIRLLVTDRPGYGESDAIPLSEGMTDQQRLQVTLERNSLLTSQLLATLSLSGGVVCLAHSAGAIAMMHFSQSYPHLINSITLIGVPTPLTPPLCAPELTVGRRMKSWMIRSFPSSFKWLFSKLITKWVVDPNEFVKFSDTQMSGEEKKFNTPILRERMKQAFTSAMHSGTAPDQLCFELISSAVPWSFSVDAPAFSNGSFPVAVWHGDVDEVTPNGPWLHGLWTASARTASRSSLSGAAAAGKPLPVLHTRPGFSHGMAYVVFEEILTEAISMAAAAEVARAFGSEESQQHEDEVKSI